MRIEISAVVNASAEETADVYADYPAWPELFPTISAVRLVRSEGGVKTLELRHSEGVVVNTLEDVPGEAGRRVLRLEEWKRAYDATFTNVFEDRPGRPGTCTFTIVGDIRLKSWRRPAAPVVRPYARRLMWRLQLEPVRNAAERREVGRETP
jgi:hypothetical protein